MMQVGGKRRQMLLNGAGIVLDVDCRARGHVHGGSAAGSSTRSCTSFAGRRRKDKGQADVGLARCCSAAVLACLRLTSATWSQNLSPFPAPLHVRYDGVEGQTEWRVPSRGRLLMWTSRAPRRAMAHGKHKVTVTKSIPFFGRS